MERTNLKIFSKILDYIGDYNPQLFRELKEQLKPIKIYTLFGLSLLFQTFVYCIYENRNQFKHMVWVDLFTTLSISGIFPLLIIGTYLLINNLSKEENSGTLNFVRLSPQSVNSIVLGKILVVPILLYLAGIIALPLHLIAGLMAGIPLILILVYYCVLIASCGFFYSGAVLFSLITSKSGTMQAFVGSGIVLFFLSSTTRGILDKFHSFSYLFFHSYHTTFDWLSLFNPAKVIPYLSGDFNPNDYNLGFWYGLPIWNNPWIAISFILLNYGIWIYWIGEGLKRRFRSSTTTIWSKKQGYWIVTGGMIILLGFVFQSNDSYAPYTPYTLRKIFTLYTLRNNFSIFQFLSLIYFILLIAALTPGRQTLQDWARYRHQFPQNPLSLVKDLLLGEKSPATLAIAVNLGIFVSLTNLLAPLESDKPTIFFGLVFEVSQILLFAVIFQFMAMTKPSKRTIGGMTTLGSLLTLAIICGSIYTLTLILIGSGINIFSVILFPIMLGEWIATLFLTIQMSQQLHKLGESATNKSIA